MDNDSKKFRKLLTKAMTHDAPMCVSVVDFIFKGVVVGEGKIVITRDVIQRRLCRKAVIKLVSWTVSWTVSLRRVEGFVVFRELFIVGRFLFFGYIR